MLRSIVITVSLVVSFGIHASPFFGLDGGGLLSGNLNVNHTVTHEINPLVSTELNSLNTNWEDTNGILNDLKESFPQEMSRHWVESNRIVDRNWSETNANLGLLNNPLHMFGLSAAAGLGMGLGNTVGQLALQIVVFGTKKIYAFLHEQITHEKSNAQLIEEFNLAKKSYEQVSLHKKELKNVVKRLLTIQQSLKANEVSISKQQGLIALKNARAIVQSKLKQTEQLKNELAAAKEWQKFALTLQDEDSLKHSESQIQIAIDNLNRFQATDLCSAAKDFYWQMQQQEKVLYEYRMTILATKKIWMKRYYEAEDKTHDKMEKSLDDARSIRNKGIKEAKSIAKQQRADFYRSIDLFHKGCVDQYARQSLNKQQLQQLLGEKTQELAGDPDKTYESPHFWLKRSYYQKICDLDFALKVKAETGSTLEDYEKERLLQIQEQLQATVDAFNSGYQNTMMHAPALLETPVERKEKLISFLEEYFAKIENDQAQSHQDESWTVNQEFAVVCQAVDG